MPNLPAGPMENIPHCITLLQNSSLPFNPFTIALQTKKIVPEKKVIHTPSNLYEDGKRPFPNYNQEKETKPSSSSISSIFGQKTEVNMIVKYSGKNHFEMLGLFRTQKHVAVIISLPVFLYEHSDHFFTSKME